ncbi:GDSL family lipase [Streptomyces sp. MST-110588]|nr:GDSL family lipase [Streptomyces sp. MST-110588]
MSPEPPTPDWLAPGPFLRGVAWHDRAKDRLVRADPADGDRLPWETWSRATVPVGVRLEGLAPGADTLHIRYRAFPPRPADELLSAGAVFELWQDGEPVCEAPARPGEDRTVRLRLPASDGPFTVHLPVPLRPRVLGLRATGPARSAAAPAPAEPLPRWAVYGDSICEGWIASRPSRAWPAVAGRALGLDPVNLGYAGSGRGEIASAQQLAALPCDLITLAFGTNCWSGSPYSAPLLRETTSAFMALVRRGHPDTPLLVLSPLLRPDAEDTPNALGATLSELRRAQEAAVADRIAAGDRGLALLSGAPLLEAADLADGLHPGDGGHARLAGAVAAALRAAGFVPLP